MTGPIYVDDDDEPFLPPRPEPLIASIRIDDVKRTLLVARHLGDYRAGGPLPLLVGALAMYLVEDHPDPAAHVDGLTASLAEMVKSMQQWKLACSRPAGNA